MSKSGKRNPIYSRYWFQLKGDVLSYYEGTTNKYLPHGHIDLRYGITASLANNDKEGLHFTLETDHRTYYFRADTSHSAKDWVNSLQRVIFRSRNEGDSVKISLPIRNVIDIEEIKMLDLETCKLRVIDNNETYAVDEVSQVLHPANIVGDEGLKSPSISSRSFNLARTLSAFSKYSSKTNKLVATGWGFFTYRLPSTSIQHPRGRVLRTPLTEPEPSTHLPQQYGRGA